MFCLTCAVFRAHELQGGVHKHPFVVFIALTAIPKNTGMHVHVVHVLLCFTYTSVVLDRAAIKNAGDMFELQFIPLIESECHEKNAFMLSLIHI